MSICDDVITNILHKHWQKVWLFNIFHLRWIRRLWDLDSEERGLPSESDEDKYGSLKAYFCTNILF